MNTIMEALRIALTKGRLEQSAVALFERMGYDCTELHHKGRKLILTIPDGPIEVVLAKAPDVITYVEHGVCHVGVVGKDTIMEAETDAYELYDLGFGCCRFALAGKKGRDFFAGFGTKTIASKYPNVTRRYFENLGLDVDVVKIEGSVELAPLLGLADAIVDIVETGSTLRENGLEIYEEIAPVSARILANRAALKIRKADIDQLLRRIETVMGADETGREKGRDHR